MALFSVNTLFDICMNFIVKRINLVDSFVGFPELIGEKIFQKFILANSSVSINGVLKKFIEAYENLILDRLSLFKSLLILNEYFESIIVISNCVTELCLCSCYLGENHDIYCHIADFKHLKKLCLRNNSANDTSIRILTVRMRMYGVGGRKVEYLDLADNNCTDNMIPRLIAFPKLNYLNLTGSKISNKGIKILTDQYNFSQIFEHKEHKAITDDGWATILLHKWRTEFNRKREEKLKGRLFKLRLPELLENSCNPPSDIPLVFQKSILSDHHEPPTKKMKL